MTAKSLVVYSPLPPHLAMLFPPPKAGGLPVHLTLMWVGRFDVAEPVFDDVCKALADLRVKQIATLGGLAYFPHERGRIAHVTVTPVDKLREIHDTLDSRLRAHGVVPSDPIEEDYNPHVTLGFLPGWRPWSRHVPSGSWLIDKVEVRHGKRHASFPLT